MTPQQKQTNQPVTVINISAVPRDLSTGRVLAPGETGQIRITGHEQALIDAGALKVVDTTSTKESA